MGGFFARFIRHTPAPNPAPNRVTQQDQAVLDLKLQRDSLQKYQKRIEIQVKTERALAKKFLLEGKRDKAKLLLKKKKYLESLLEKTDGQLSNLETMVSELEYAQIEIQVVEGLRSGNQALAQMHNILSIEDVESLMSDTEDAIQYQQEIDQLLGTQLTQVDEEALLAELDQITRGEDAQLLEGLPDAPTGLPTDKEIQPVGTASKHPEKRTAIAT